MAKADTVKQSLMKINDFSLKFSDNYHPNRTIMMNIFPFTVRIYIYISCQYL